MSTIEVTLKGLLVIYVSADELTCTVGFLDKTPPHHGFKISVLKGDAAGTAGSFQLFTEIDAPDISHDLTIEVKNTSTSGISRRDKGVHARIARASGPAGGNDESFLWVLDFKRDLYHKPIGTNLNGFKSLLTVNNGELLTRKISENKLFTIVNHTGPAQEFGFVAVESGIDIVLDQPQSTAVFKNGGRPVFVADSQSSFKVIFDRGIPLIHHHAVGNDGDFYYTAIGHLIPGPEKKFFSSYPTLAPGPGLLVTPDAACFNGGGGTGP